MSVGHSAGIAVPIGTVLNLRKSFLQKCEAVPRRARVEGSSTCVSLNSRLESNEEKEACSFGLEVWSSGLRACGLKF